MKDIDGLTLFCIFLLLMALFSGCSAHHELAVETRVERTAEPHLVATYRMVLP